MSTNGNLCHNKLPLNIVFDPYSISRVDFPVLIDDSSPVSYQFISGSAFVAAGVCKYIMIKMGQGKHLRVQMWKFDHNIFCHLAR